MSTKKWNLSIGALFFLLAGDCVLQAQTDIRVQTTTDGSATALQAGWDLVDGGRNTSPISGTVDGVTITVGANPLFPALQSSPKASSFAKATADKKTGKPVRPNGSFSGLPQKANS